MPTLEERKKRTLFADPAERQEMMQPFEEPVAPAPEISAPRFMPREEWDQLTRAEERTKMLGLLAPERKEEMERYHKRTAQVDALGRAIGALGGFVSAHMGGPVLPHQPGRAKEHIDRYQQLILDYEKEKRAHDLAIAQQKIQEDKAYAEHILRQKERAETSEERAALAEEQRRHQEKMAETQITHRETLEQKRQDWRIKEEIPAQTKQQKEILRKRDEIQQSAERRASIEAQRQAGQAVGEEDPESKWYTMRAGGRNVRVGGAVARQLAGRLTDEEAIDLFGDADFSYTATNLEKVLERFGEKYLVPRQVIQDGQVVRGEMDLRTRAEKLPDPDDMGALIAGVAAGVRDAGVPKGAVKDMLEKYMDVEGAPGMAISDANEFADRLAEAFFTPTERDREGNLIHPLQDIPLPKGMRKPKGWPEGWEKNFFNLLLFYDDRYQEGVERRHDVRQRELGERAIRELQEKGHMYEALPHEQSLITPFWRTRRPEKVEDTGVEEEPLTLEQARAMELWHKATERFK